MTTIISVAGYKKTGKTTTVKRLIRSLKKRGYTIASAKFMHIPHMDLDVKGKDTYEHMAAGADLVFSVTPTGTVMFKKTTQREKLKDIVDSLPETVDFLICEGLRENGFGTRFILTAKEPAQIDSLEEEIGQGRGNIVGVTGIVAGSLQDYTKYQVFDCLNESGIEKLTDAVVNLGK